MFEKCYRYWATQKGLYTDVKKLKYLGLRGWHGYIQKKNIDGIDYAGEIYECLTLDGRRIRGVFRIPYDEIDTIYQTNLQEVDYVIKEVANYHTDGIKAWETNDFRLYDNRQLKRREIELKERIIKLKTIFETLNNLDNAELKLAIQLYLRRLETPDHFTSRDWKNCTIKNKVIDLL